MFKRHKRYLDFINQKEKKRPEIAVKSGWIVSAGDSKIAKNNDEEENIKYLNLPNTMSTLSEIVSPAILGPFPPRMFAARLSLSLVVNFAKMLGVLLSHGSKVTSTSLSAENFPVMFWSSL